MLVFLNALVFLHEAQLFSGTLEQFISRYALVPARLTAPGGLAEYWPTLFTSMVLHGGSLHIIGKWYLWIFGDNEAPARELARTLSEGRWTHDYPLAVAQAEGLGLPVKTGLPEEICDLMRLYPQRWQPRPSVEFVPAHYHPAPQDEVRRPERALGRR